MSWAAGGKAAALAENKKTPSWAHSDPSWLKLAAAIEQIKPLQEKDGSIDSVSNDLAIAKVQIDLVLEAIVELAPRFSHQADYLAAVQKDI